MNTKKNKQTKLHLKIGDNVQIIAGNAKGEQGRVIKIDREKMRAFVGGVKMVTRHIKPSASQPDSKLIQKEASIHLSNIMVIDPKNDKPRRTGRKLDDKGKLQRYFKEHTSLKDEK